MASGVSFSALSGGVASELSGGNFWKGAGVGATIGLLNHYGKPLQQRLERPGKVNLKKNPVRGLKRWMRYIHRYKGVDPLSRRAFHLSDVVDAESVPYDWDFIDKLCGVMPSADGVSDGIRWFIKDATVSNGYENNITRIGTPSKGMAGSQMIIRAYRHATYGVFSLTFSDYNTYVEYCKFIGIEPKY